MLTKTETGNGMLGVAAQDQTWEPSLPARCTLPVPEEDKGEDSEKTRQFILTPRTADQLSSKQFQAVFYLSSMVFQSCECFSAI